MRSPRRLRKAAKLCLDCGLRRVQKSVFLGDLDGPRTIALREGLLALLDREEDRALLVPVSRRDLAASVEVGPGETLRSVLERQESVFV